MRLMFASDIHGSLYYCNKMIEAYEREGADKLVLLGDLLYHGPRNDLPKEYAPKAVIELLNSYADKIICVRGNCEAEVDQMVLKFPVMADYACICTDDRVMYVTHGHTYNKDNMLPMNEGEYMLHGHTHVPVCIKKNNRTIMNPGSVSIPKENSPHGYMVYDRGEFVWKTLEGEIYQVNVEEL